MAWTEQQKREWQGENNTMSRKARMEDYPAPWEMRLFSDLSPEEQKHLIREEERKMYGNTCSRPIVGY